jgi:hypothetical protein
VVSGFEDISQVLRSLPLGLKKYLLDTADDQTVGIVPTYSSVQQLFFFLKVDPAAHFGTTSSTSALRMQILFNANIVLFENGYIQKGIDFAGYNNATGTWEAEDFPCYNALSPDLGSCRWYNQDGNSASPFNKSHLNKAEIKTISGENIYGVATFDCGKENGIFVGSECNLFKGRTNSMATGEQGVISLRYTKFPNNFMSQIYADDQLLDFVVSFSRSENNALAFTTGNNTFTL